MTLLASARQKPALKSAAVLLSLSLLLPACQNPNASASGQPLTAEQQAMRQQSQRWNQTAATGALAGAATGAAAAAAFGRGNTGQNALIGAGIGALVGLAAGMAVAERNLAFENREASASQRIQSAQQVANNLNNTAAASEQVAKQISSAWRSLIGNTARARSPPRNIVLKPQPCARMRSLCARPPAKRAMRASVWWQVPAKCHN